MMDKDAERGVEGGGGGPMFSLEQHRGQEIVPLRERPPPSTVSLTRITETTGGNGWRGLIPSPQLMTEWGGGVGAGGINL